MFQRLYIKKWIITLSISTVLSSIFLFPIPIFIGCFYQTSTVNITLYLKTSRGLPLEEVEIKIEGVYYGSSRA